MLIIFFGAIVVGLIIGLLGSGGSAVTVPILVYLVGHDAKISIAESMAIAGTISAVSAIPFARNKVVDWNSVVLFGIPAMLGTFVGAWLGGYATDALQLIVFGLVLFLAAGFMIKKAFGKVNPKTVEDVKEKPPLTISKAAMIVFEGLVVGVLTGFVGVGGGFLIVPALLLLGKLPMRTAIGTSLVIVFMKSVVGFLKYQSVLAERSQSVDWTTIGIFVGIGLFGSMLGQQLNTRLNQRALTQVFAVFLIMLGGFIIFREGSELMLGNEQVKEPVAVVQPVEFGF